ncbi:hypothetical protein QBC40DRAFT_176246, partial [Triangularia verruculosa]
KKKKKAGQTSIEHPPQPSAQGQVLEDGVQIIATFCSKSQDRKEKAKVKKASLCRCRGYASSTRVGSVAPLGNTEEDKYYRNDSLKYCRHEEKKRKGKEMTGGEPIIYSRGMWPVRACKFAFTRTGPLKF